MTGRAGIDRVRAALRARVLGGPLGSTWYRFWELRQAFRPEALRESRRLRTERADGFAVPSPRRIVGIAGNASTAWYLGSGANDVRRVLDRLATAGVDPEQLGTVLDFGCGCGRLTRRLLVAGADRVIGCDIDRRAITWCRRNLPGEFHAIGLDPPLPLEAGSVDLIVAYSVFTHLDAPRLALWLDELHRVLAPGGILALTAHGSAYRSLIAPELLPRFDAGDMVVQHARNAGSNLCAAFHPRAFLERALERHLSVIDIEPGGAAHAAPQDLYLARK
jgi:SAM-dependent methyltransferase